jgi:GGDEF domain-containing protein
MAKRNVNPLARERRVALEKRRRVAEMSPEELRRELLTSEVTGLPNRRAFAEATTVNAVAMTDVDGLKALNEFGYEVGNAVLKAKADVLRETGLEAYHDKGDEFLCRGHSIKAVIAQLERARTTLRDRTILVAQADGNTLGLSGADFSFGVGKDINEAECLLKRHKSERERRGEIARGELRGITIRRMNRRSASTESVPATMITSVISSGTKVSKSSRSGRIVNRSFLEPEKKQWLICSPSPTRGRNLKLVPHLDLRIHLNLLCRR